MRRIAVILAVQAAALAGLALPAEAQGRGSCNRGTAHAHETVPHHATEAHEHIPHC